MKNVILGGLLALLFTVLLGCDNSSLVQENHSSEILILIDETDTTFTNSIHAQEIINLLLQKTKADFSDVYNGSFEVGVYGLNQLLVTESNYVSLPPSKGLLDVHKKRKEAQNKFLNAVKSTIDKTKATIEMKSSSKLIWPIFNRLNKLAQSKADKRMVFVFSDLFEHNDEISFYKASPEKVTEYIHNVFKNCNDLSGIKCYCVFQPTNVKDDKRFHVIQKAWTEVLEAKNAQFIHLPNL